MPKSLLLPALFWLLSGAAQAADDPAARLLGDWSGTIHERTEAKPFGLSFSQKPDELPAMYFDLPEGSLLDAGPIYFTLQDDGYKADVDYFHFKLHLSGDGKQLTGTMLFDGNTLPFELQRGKLARPAATQDTAPIVKPTWTFKTGAPIWSSPDVADGNVYFGSNDGYVYALEIQSGTERWRAQTGGPVYGSPAASGDAVYVLSDDGFLYKLERVNGKAVWRFDTHGGSIKRVNYERLASRPAVSGGLVYVGSADGNLYAVDADKGTERWHFETGGPVRSDPAVADGRVFFGSMDDYVYAVDASTGALRWQYDTLKPVVSSPLVADGTVYVGSRSANLFAFEAATGRVKWRKFYWTSWVESSARLRDGVLYVGSSDYHVMLALDARTGNELWRFNTHGEAWPDPAVTEKHVYTGSVGHSDFGSQAGFYALDRASGKEIWRFPMTPQPSPLGNGVNSSPLVSDGQVLFGALDGNFYALPAQD